jgi:hypothetical protein
MNSQNLKPVIKISKLEQNRITVAFLYNPEFVQKIKTIEGHRGILMRNTGAFHQTAVFWISLSLYLKEKGLRLTPLYELKAKR